MIRRSTVVYIMILLAVIGAFLYLNNRELPAEELATLEPTSQVSYLFPAEEGSPTSITIHARTGEAVELVRNAENAWSLIQPVEAGAEQAASEAAASQVTTMRVLERIPEIDPGLVGLEEPDYLLDIKFSSGTERSVRVGVITPTESGYYVQEAAGGGEVLIVSKSSMEALLRLLTEPPYLETPTPNPDLFETETATPSPP